MSVTKLKTILALGLCNVARVAVYRLGIKLGIHPAQHARAEVPAGPFFAPVSPSTLEQRKGLQATRAWQDEAVYFGWYAVPLDGPPDWHMNPFTGARVANPERPWWQIADFDSGVGDIKTVWEASRFDWAIAFAQRAATGDAAEIAKLNAWLADWLTDNPPYHGPNWKCAQETSIRVMHLAMAALITGQAALPCEGLLELLALHLKRIAPTLSYAIAQQNNHATSEAAALFIGGSWLAANGHPQGQRWAQLGRAGLEHRTAQLVMRDGSFSQYSVNYHRVLLDTLSMAEMWRRHHGLAPFSARWQQRAGTAAQWLYAMVDAASGDAPNIGANDGARLLPLTDTGYRDFRPSVQLAMALFAQRRAYGDAASQLVLAWLDVTPSQPAAAPESQQFDDGGYTVLREGKTLAVLRYPRFRFRPSQADALHLDLWRDGQNLLRDGGTFSYADAEAVAYFSGTQSHNTVQFDGRDQMPRLSRFLFGDWLKAREVQQVARTADGLQCAAAYRDRCGARHRRQVTLTADGLQVRDEIGGFRKAVLRWRLAPGEWRVEGSGVTDGRQRISIRAEGAAIARLALTQGFESRFYLQKTALPVLEVEVDAPAVLVTEYRWHA